MITLSRGLALMRALLKLSSLFMGNKSWSLGSMYDTRNGISFKLCKRSIKVRKSSNFGCEFLSRLNLLNSASNWNKLQLFI